MKSEKIEISPEIAEISQDLMNFQNISDKMGKVDTILEELNEALAELPEGHHAYEIADEIYDLAEQITEMSARMMAGWWFGIHGYHLPEEEK
jgi:uncharacterized phage infection (PIP) family protein YhgE